MAMTALPAILVKVPVPELPYGQDKGAHCNQGNLIGMGKILLGSRQ
jgi:hypothetical protein